MHGLVSGYTYILLNFKISVQSSAVTSGAAIFIYFPFLVQSAGAVTTVPPGDKSGKFAPKFCLVLKFNCQLRATGGHNLFFVCFTNCIKYKLLNLLLTNFALQRVKLLMFLINC